MFAGPASFNTVESVDVTIYFWVGHKRSKWRIKNEIESRPETQVIFTLSPIACDITLVAGTKREGGGGREKSANPPPPSLFLFLLIPYPFWRLLPRRLPRLHWANFWISFLKSNLVATVKSSHLLLVKNNTLFNFIMEWLMMLECAGFSYTLRKFLSQETFLLCLLQHSTRRESVCRVPIIMYFVFSGWAVAVLERSRWSCGHASIENSIISK